MRADASRYRLSDRDPAADTVWWPWPCERFALAALFIGYASGVEVR
jgi:hypothetical protein